MICLNTAPYIRNDNNLYDVSTYSKELGINIPTYISHHLWQTHINPGNDSDSIDISRRLWDVLELLLSHIKSNLHKEVTYPIEFTFACCLHCGNSQQLNSLPLKGVLTKDADRKHSLIVKLVSE